VPKGPWSKEPGDKRAPVRRTLSQYSPGKRKGTKGARLIYAGLISHRIKYSIITFETLVIETAFPVVLKRKFDMMIRRQVASYKSEEEKINIPLNVPKHPSPWVSKMYFQLSYEAETQHEDFWAYWNSVKYKIRNYSLSIPIRPLNPEYRKCTCF